MNEYNILLCLTDGTKVNITRMGGCINDVLDKLRVDIESNKVFTCDMDGTQGIINMSHVMYGELRRDRI